MLRERSMDNAPLLTIFIPTYNRSHTITRALDSVLNQTDHDYELLIIDDGSTDNTQEVISQWAEVNAFELRLFLQERGGKHRAFNKAVRLSRGELLMVLDSDDELVSSCVADIKSVWQTINSGDAQAFAGVEGLCQTSEGVLHGSKFPGSDYYDGTHLEIWGRYNVTGEKRNAIRVDVLKKYPYPEVEGEFHVRPSFIWKKIAHHYRFRFINRVLQVVDFSDGGLTKTSSARRLRNVKGLFLYWDDDIQYHQDYLDFKRKSRHYGEFVRYASHAGVSCPRQLMRAPSKLLWLAGSVRGLPNYYADRVKTRLRK